MATQPDATTSVRGKDRFVGIGMDHFRYRRECELDATLDQSRAD